MNVFKLLVGLTAINGLLIAPEWLLLKSPDQNLIALESFLIVGSITLLPSGRWRTNLARTAAFFVLLVSILLFANAVTWQSLARPLNLYLDLHLLGAVYNLMDGMLGTAMAVPVILGTLLGISLLPWLLSNLLSPDDNRKGNLSIRVTGLVLIAWFFAALTSHNIFGASQRMTLPAVKIIADQARHIGQMMRERERFITQLAEAPTDYADLPHLLEQLQNRDVVMAFVESYGLSALYDPKYSPVIQPRLNDLAGRMADAGLHLATGALVAPTQGGQSWLSHLSLFSGIWLDNQLRYDIALASGRETLLDDFRRAGHRTIALLPANTMAWPEGKLLAYDKILSRRDIDYAGPSLNWVTMPDQFTWSFLERSVLTTDSTNDRPVFVEVCLISSHAPWTPILPVLEDWDNIEDGEIFTRWENAGERPEDLWRDQAKVQQHYSLSIDYAIQAMTGYAERYVDNKILLIVLGDHQAAPLITGENASRAVPVHVISGDQTLVQPFLDWGFENGALPNPDQPSPGMDVFRDWFVRAFSSPVLVPEVIATTEHG